jgi:endo-beta-N-acetylglucosaminidase D
MPTARTLYTAMVLLLAKATDRLLARMVSYLKEENKLAASTVAGKGQRDAMGAAAVSPDTFLRWLPEESRVEHYNRERPHLAKDNDLLVSRPKEPRRLAADDEVPMPEIRCGRRLGGLLKQC